jgi:hypothetical protein
MNALETILAVAALIFGVVGVVEANGRNWVAWGVVCLAVIVLIGRFG